MNANPRILPPAAEVLLQRAMSHHHAGRLHEAEPIYRSILETHRQHPDTNHNLGVLLMQTGQPAAALMHFKAALAADATQGQYWLSYIEALMRGGQPDAARQALAEARQNGLRGARMDALATALGVPGAAGKGGAPSGKPDSRKPAKPAQAGKGPDPVEMNRLVALFNTGRLAECEAGARALTVRFPAHGFGWKALGAVLMHQGLAVKATPALRKAAELLADDAETHNNLGSALLDLGQPGEAAASFRRALAIRPDYAEAHNNLGNALQDLGQPSEAVASYRRALTFKPSYAEAHNNLGNALQALGQLDEALSCYRRALEIKPDHAKACNNLGNALQDLGLLNDAMACYQRALEIKPDYVEACVHLGHLLKWRGMNAEAEASYRRALGFRPDYAEAWIALGMLHTDTGAFSEAETCFRRALKIRPDHPAAWAELAGIRKMTPEDAAWMATAEKIAGQRIPPGEEIILRFAMGKYCDDTGDFDRAFLNYRHANELRKKLGRKYDRQWLEATFDRFIHDYDADWLRRTRAGASNSMRPLFIVGMPRSGTSLTEQIIASHPATFGAGELHFWDDAAKKLEPPATLAALDATMLQGMASDCLQYLDRFSADALRVTDKKPHNFFHLGLIHAVFPNARILHTQRNPVDTCLSIYFQNFSASHTYANDLDDLAHYYRQYHRLMAHWRAVLPPEVFLDVPYDALVEDQEGWSRRIIEFIGLEWNESCLNFHETERKVGTASNWQVRQKIYKSSKERWRNYEQHVGPLLGLLELD